MRLLPALLAVLVLVGCDAADPEDGLRLLTDATAYAADATATLSLLNDGAAEAYAHPSLCGAFTQRRAAGDWVEGPPLILCTGVVANVAPSETVVTDYPLTDLDPGTYRFVYEVHGEYLVSNTFEIAD